MMRTIPILAPALALALSAAIAPAAADSGDVQPIVDVGSGALLGGAADGEWLEPETTAGEMKGGEIYRTWDLNRKLQTMQGTAPEFEGEPCHDTLYVELSPPLDTEDSQLDIGAIAVGGDWNTMPRQPKMLSPGQQVYRDAAATWLKENSLADPVIELEQVVRVDLEDDGVDEVLLTANYRTPRPVENMFGAMVGDYSFVLLRRLKEGKVETLELAADIHADARPGDINYFYRLAAILDLNGDGVMEIVVENGYYEGGGVGVFTVEGGEPELILHEGCGA